MKHDFTSIPDRSGCGAAKWNRAKNSSTEFVPLSVADMEFPTAKPIREALKRIAEDAILGYTDPTEAYFDAVIGWMKRRHDFEVKKEWIIQTPGIITALEMLVEATTNAGDGVIIMSPVYYPFDMAVVAASRKIVYCPLIHENGEYSIDYALLEKKAKDKNNTALLFCNPHNPIGKVWSPEEMEKVAEICFDNGVFIIDDEIHNDLIMPGYSHTVMANVSEKAMNNIAVCTAPSKTFNLAGMQCSNIIIPSEKMRKRAIACNWLDMQMHLNIFAYAACTAAYNECEDWLEELITVIADNAKCVEVFMAENFPEIKVYPLEGTYLQWLDMRALGMTHVELRNMLEGANIYLDGGEMFGPLGRGFQRINLACARETLEKTLVRFKNAVDDLRADWAANGRPHRRTLSVGTAVDGFVYESAKSTHCELENVIDKKALIVFTRFYECDITQKLLAALAAAYPAAKAMGCEIKAVVQSDIATLAPVQGRYPFELIADPEAKLFERYNVFEADSAVNLIAGDKLFESMAGKDIRKLIGTDLLNLITNTADPVEGRKPLQLCAFIGIDKDMRVIYSHYSKTLSDYPDVKEIIKAMI